MANGDDAAAAGMDVVAGTADRRLGYDEINKTRDYIAQRTSTVTPITKGGTGATTAAAARTALDVPSNAALTSGLAGKQDALGYTPVRDLYAGVLGLDYDNPTGDVKVLVDSTYISMRRADNGQFGSTPIYTPHGRANGVSGGLTAYIGADGRVAVAPSSRRFKRDIQAMSIDQQAVLAMQAVSFHYRTTTEPDGTETSGTRVPLEHGLIAEDLHALGLTWLVAYDDEGAPFAVHYDKLALALLPVVQDHERRIAALEQKALGVTVTRKTSS